MARITFRMPPFKTHSWLTIERAAEITGAAEAAILSAIDSGRVSWKAVLEGSTQYTLVDRSQILAYFRELTPAA